MKVWTNYWKNRAADRMRRIRELETAIREYQTMIRAERSTPTSLTARHKLFEVLYK